MIILRILGTRSPYLTKGKAGPGFMVYDEKANIILDCGAAIECNMSLPSELKNLHVFITHFHRDHYIGLFHLQYAAFCFHNQGRLDTPVKVYLPSSPEEIVKDIVTEKNAYCEYETITPDSEFFIEDMSVTFLKVLHDNMEAYAIKVKSGDTTFVYTGDVSYASSKELIEFAKDANCLISEASLLESFAGDNLNSNHLTALQAATIAKEANVKKLIITHLWPELNENEYFLEAVKVFPNLRLAKEGEHIYVN